MLTYFILIIGTLIVCTFSLHDRLRSIQRTQQFHSEWLLELISKSADPMLNRLLFQPGGHPPKELNPAMLTPYLAIMSDEQNLRYRQWLLAKPHVAFTTAEIRELEKILAAYETQ